MPRWLKILLGIAAGFGIFVIGIVVFVFWLTSGLVDPIDRQIAALKAGDMKSAYEETSEAFRQATSMEDFAAFVDTYPILKDVASHTFSNRSFQNDAGTVEGTLTSSTGGVIPVTYQLVKERGEWKIINIKVGAAPGTTSS